MSLRIPYRAAPCLRTQQEIIIKTYRNLFLGLFALVPLLSLGLVANDASAQQYNSSATVLRIDGFSVDEVPALKPGAELSFSLNGTPGATATLRIAGAQRGLNLNEVDAGIYEGTYAIGIRDNITANSAVTANLRLGNQVVSTVLDESLQRGVGYRSGKAADGFPRITGLDVVPSAELTRGNQLAFTLNGTPGGRADLKIDGMKGKFLLQEVRRGEYTGVYTIRPRDRITANSQVIAELRAGERVVSGKLVRSLQSTEPNAYRAARMCIACGTVESVNVVETKGDGGYLGTIGGGVVGALLGNQIGSGNGRTAATIAGAVGGAYAGRTIEGNVRKNSHHEVQVRLNNGGQQTITFAADPGYKVGDKVKIVDGGLVRDI
ncbi:glycine zipper 2TM domain-containing protein [Lacisediminimonas sp.]|uniref:glycine zipper 2TM domain-containing protein n=1 Tax=Lacisediminimonas sp. TaxID=3060582 RepID=UPI00272B3756|nr:glycine zipper 2TM domain-containing protein [Lacisediminimonas sp.]